MARPITKLKEIEESAIRLFSKKGISQVTIKEIAKEAKCAEGALYRHYKSKEEMAWVLLKREIERFGKELEAVFSSDESYLDRVKRSIHTFYAYYQEEPVSFKFTLLSQHGFPDKKRLMLKAYLPVNLLTDFFKRGVDDGAFVIEDIPLFVSIVLGLVMAPPTSHSIGRLSGNMEDYADGIIEICLMMLSASSNK